MGGRGEPHLIYHLEGFKHPHLDNLADAMRYVDYLHYYIIPGINARINNHEHIQGAKQKPSS